MNPINDRIRRQRMKLNKTVKSIAEELNVPVSTYRDWEYGRAIKIEYLVSLSQILQISVLELLTGESFDNHILLEQVLKLEEGIKQLRSILS
jgi:transcriptional regulator with XRE-family HTH domain